MTLAAVLVLAALLGLAGANLLPDAPERRIEGRLVLAFVGGALALHALLLYSHFVGVAWSRALILLVLLPAAALGLRRGWRLRGPGARAKSTLSDPAGLSWGDAVAAVAVLGAGALAYTGWTASPDFIYHWGVKGHKFFLARGLDLEFLTAPWNLAVIHPDYPILVPGLFAATALLRGVFHDTAGLFWAPVQMALMLLAARWWLARQAPGRLEVQAGMVLLAGFLGATQIAMRRAGDADWAIALVLLAAAPLLARPARAADDLPVGLLAAFAAASKMEGLPLAAFLVAIHGVRRLRQEGGVSSATVARWLLPGAVVVAPWAWTVWRYQLLAPGNLGAPRLDQLGEILAAMADRATSPGWHGSGLAVLLLLPLLWGSARLRPLALLLTLQLGFYLFAYMATPLDPVALVLTSFERLLWHLAPTVLVAATLWLGTMRSGPGPETLVPAQSRDSAGPEPAVASSGPGSGPTSRLA